MDNGYEKAMRHARKIAEIQRRKRMAGDEPAFPGHDKNDIVNRHLDKLKNRLKAERTREISKHPERRILAQGERHRQPLKCLETGEIFHSLKDLAQRTGLTAATISIQISKNRKIHGYTYIRISKEDEKKETRNGKD